MAWIGPAIGSFVGLIAILLGALYNAKLTRERDERLREAELESLRAVLAAELISVSMSLEMCSAIASDEVHGRTSKGVEVIEAFTADPTSLAVDRIGDRLGLLPAQQAADFMLLWHRVRLVRNLLNGTLAELRAGIKNEKGAEQRFGIARDVSVECHDMAKALSGALGLYTKPIPVLTREAAADVLTRRPGDKAWMRLRDLGVFSEQKRADEEPK